MSLFDQVSNDIKEAMKARNKVRLETLRNIKKVFLEAKTAPGANDTLDDSAALKLLQKLAKQGKESAATYVQQGRQDLADDELARLPLSRHSFRNRSQPKKSSKLYAPSSPKQVQQASKRWGK